jgi:4-hydroxyphenylpyruvate dioxygenase
MKTQLKSQTIENPENPMQLDGFEFVEFSGPDSAALDSLFKQLGMKKVAQHKSKDIALYRQNEINFLLNNIKNSQAEDFSRRHGPCACSMAFRVKDAKMAYERAIQLGAKPCVKNDLNQFAIEGIGGSLLYLIDQYTADNNLYENDFDFLPGVDKNPKGNGLNLIDHLTHNVYQGEMDRWANFYYKIFNFFEIRFFDIEGEITGLTSRALSSPCGKIKIPLNQSKDDFSQIEEYLKEYKGEGIQHIALTTNDIYTTVEELRNNNLEFLSVPDTYYEMLDKRIPGHNENLNKMRKNKLLIDGSTDSKEGLLLQIFTQNVIGPIFFEIIQRKGNDGFGEGNFTALFESIERDQIRRGVISKEKV